MRRRRRTSARACWRSSTRRRTRDPNVKHTGQGEGGGLLGRCPIVLKDTTITTADLPNGSKMTVVAKDATEVDWLRRETRDREEDLKLAGSPAGTGKMAHCPSAIAGVSTTLKNTKDGVSVILTATDAPTTKSNPRAGRAPRRDLQEPRRRGGGGRDPHRRGRWRREHRALPGRAARHVAHGEGHPERLAGRREGGQAGRGGGAPGRGEGARREVPAPGPRRERIGGAGGPGQALTRPRGADGRWRALSNPRRASLRATPPRASRLRRAGAGRPGARGGGPARGSSGRDPTSRPSPRTSARDGSRRGSGGDRGSALVWRRTMATSRSPVTVKVAPSSFAGSPSNVSTRHARRSPSTKSGGVASSFARSRTGAECPSMSTATAISLAAPASGGGASFGIWRASLRSSERLHPTSIRRTHRTPSRTTVILSHRVVNQADYCAGSSRFSSQSHLTPARICRNPPTRIPSGRSA